MQACKPRGATEACVRELYGVGAVRTQLRGKFKVTGCRSDQLGGWAGQGAGLNDLCLHAPGKIQCGLHVKYIVQSRRNDGARPSSG